MSQPIITTDISNIRPVFAEGAGENIKRYTQLKKMFKAGKEYTVLAEPMPDGGNKITWHTEFDGTPAAYSQLTEEEQRIAKGRIKYQVNKLYKEVFRQLYRGSMSDVADMFRVLDSCIEIPDYDNIYRIQKPDGKSNFVLIKWGFNSDDFNAKDRLIARLVPTKVDTVKIKVIKNSKAAPNEKVIVTYSGREVQLVTDSKGYVMLEDIPLGDKFSACSSDKDNITEYVCDGSDEYHLLIGTKSADMNFVVCDAKGVPLTDTEVSFTYDGKTYFETTDDQGRIRLRDIPEGTEVLCKQRSSSQTFVCDTNRREYEFEGSRPVAEIEVTVMNESGEGVPGADVKFSYVGGNDFTVSTDRNGKVFIDNMPPDTEYEIICTAEMFQSATSKLSAHEGLNMAEIKLRRISTTGCMTVRVTDDDGNPVVNTLVRCETDDFKSEFYTNDNGEIAIDGVSYNSKVICTQLIDGLGVHRHVFTFVSDSDVYVLKGKKILVDGTKLEIHVTTKGKDNVPNLRVRIDDGHNVVNKFTNSDGMLYVSELKRGCRYTISTEYDGKETELEFVPSKELEKLNIQVGHNDLGFLLWLIPLVAGLLWFILAFVVPKVSEMVNAPIIAEDTCTNKQTDTIQSVIPVDTVAKDEPVVPNGITLTILDEKTGVPVEGAKIHLEYGNKKADAVSDAAGKFNFADVPNDSTLSIKALVNADGHKEMLLSFTYTPEKTISISENSVALEDIPVKCGETIKSMGYHSTIKTVAVETTSGKLTIGYDMFNIPDELIVYSGKASEISDSKIIFRTNGLVKGPFKKSTFDFNSPDGLVTVRINGGDNSRTEWYFKVYCPSKPKNNNGKNNKKK